VLDPEQDRKEVPMEIVVVGGTRLLGSKIVEKLHEGSHQPCRRHRSRARSTLTAVGSAGALDGVDMTSAPSFEDAAALRFTFQTSMRNLSSFEDWLNQTMIRQRGPRGPNRKEALHGRFGAGRPANE
jgi:hypothetical protein